MLDQLLASIAPEESFTILLSRDKKGVAKVILTAKVDLDLDEKDEARRQLLVALAQPLVIRLDAGDSAGEELEKAVREFASEQKASRDALAEYQANHSANRARAATASTASEPVASKKEAQADSEKESGSNPAPSPSADESANPPSLF